MNTIIHLIRHGEVHNPRKIVYGRLPRFGLSEHGREQASAAGEYLQSVGGLDALYTSPMLRARQTGKIINEMIPVPVHRSTLINEVECQYDGQPLSVVEAIDWDIYTGAPPEYEQPPEVVTRLQRFLERTCRRHPGQRIAAVTHAHLLSFAVIWAKGQTDFHYFKERLDELGIADPFPMPASVVTLTFAPSASLPHIAYTHPHTEKVGA